MKIITKGSLPELKTYRATCRNCKTVFEFLKKEAIFVNDQRDGSFLKVQCPLEECKNEVTVGV